ncbi:MAG: HD domain-containing protein [Candidatus Eisenbacteria bacterium]
MPAAKIRQCQDLPSLILGEIPPLQRSLCLKNLDLLTSLAQARSPGIANHGSRVGEHAERLCGRLGLSEGDVIAITTAAYLHDIGTSYYGIAEVDDARQVLELTTRLLSSLNYPDVITKILASAYTELPEVVETFINMIQKAILNVQTDGGITQVMILCDRPVTRDTLDHNPCSARRTSGDGMEGCRLLDERVKAGHLL